MANSTWPDRGTDTFCSNCKAFVKQVTCPDPDGRGHHKLQYGPKITVDGIVEVTENRFVLVKRKKGAAAKKLALPGGYVDFRERCISAVKREVDEETGIDIPLEGWELVGVYDDPERDREYGRNNVSLVYAATWEGDAPQQPAPDDPEVEELVYLRSEEIGQRRSEIAFDHYDMLTDYIAGRRPGLRWLESDVPPTRT